MSTRWTSVVTSAGLDLLARVQGHIFNFTKAQCGSDSVDIAELINQTAVSDFKKNLSITSISNTSNITKLRLQLNNTTIETAFNLYQIGVFAKLDGDPSDVLFMIIQADTPDYVPSATESPNFVNDYLVNVFVGNAESVTGTIDTAAYITVGQLGGLVSLANDYTDDAIEALAGEGNTITVKALDDKVKLHEADYTNQTRVLSMGGMV